MARVRGKNSRLEEMKIRRSPRIQKILSPPEKKTPHVDQRGRRGRPAGRSKRRTQVSKQSPSLGIEVQIPVNNQPNDTKEDEEMKTQREGEDQANIEDKRGETPKEEKVAGLKAFSQPQHPKYEGCMWINGSLIPPYCGVRRWKPLGDAEIEPLLGRYETQIREWASEYAAELGDGVDSEEALSEQERKLIMDRLGSYCSYRDWNSLIEGLSPKKDRPEVSMPGSPHTPVMNDSDGKEQENPLLQMNMTPDSPPEVLPDNSTDDIADVKSDSVLDGSNENALDEVTAKPQEPKVESPTDVKAASAINTSSENHPEGPVSNSSDAPAASTSNTPPSSPPSSSSEAVTSSHDVPPLNVPKRKRPHPPELSVLLVECLISKCLYEKIIQDPFYYLVKAEDTKVSSVPTTFGRDFYNIWQKLMRASRVKAQRIRMEMTQLLNGFDIWDQCHDISIGAQSRTLRKQALERLITSLLGSSSAIHPLLRPLDDPKKSETRFKRLLQIFREAAEIAIWMYTQESYFLFTDNIATLGPFDGQITGREECLELGYKEAEDTMRPHWFTRRDYPEGMLNGRTPVLMIRPVLKRVFVDSWTSCALNDRPGTVVSRAVVCLGRDEPLDENRTKW
ncbi:uncharacterized protein KD926_011035 [Aspergillus affinis]|uniref:uncharacterized protein n=1 Tax=Aspergillus affinis TaxID=1070780 RepID=UPI0022FDE587|nr:uncharacterized protein KD926_011035 [Aspergillus affinis]KAI9044862.1 hypothetical protein KD926_011035 [Aspergillus affinis]